MKAALIAGAAAAIAGLAAGYTSGGPRGLVIVGTILAAAALLAARAAAIPAAPWRLARRGRAPSDVSPADFPAYRQIAADVGWGEYSRRHYDRVTRPMLGRLLGAVLAERYRLDMGQHPQEARRLVGADLWPLIDPSARPSDGSEAPGVGVATLEQIVDRLERLGPDQETP